MVQIYLHVCRARMATAMQAMGIFTNLTTARMARKDFDTCRRFLMAARLSIDRE